MNWFSSDWHLGHQRSIEFADRPFASVEGMDKTIIENMIAPLRKGDRFFFLGDMAWKNHAEFFKAFPRKVEFHWILGNHDETRYKPFNHYCTTISKMKEIRIQKIPVTLCHYPMVTWNKSHYNAWMLYGHHHNKSHGTAELSMKAPGKMLNVNCEFHDFKPWSEEEIVEYMRWQDNNWDFIPRRTYEED